MLSSERQVSGYISFNDHVNVSKNVQRVNRKVYLIIAEDVEGNMTDISGKYIFHWAWTPEVAWLHQLLVCPEEETTWASLTNQCSRTWWHINPEPLICPNKTCHTNEKLRNSIKHMDTTRSSKVIQHFRMKTTFECWRLPRIKDKTSHTPY